MSILTLKISDDLFLVIDHVFTVFACLLPVSTVNLMKILYYVTYMTLFLPNILYFRTKHSFMTLFLVSSYFVTHPTLILEILGGRMHGPSPTSNFLGAVPPVPPGEKRYRNR